MHGKKGVLALRVCNTTSLYSIRESTEIVNTFFKGSTLFIYFLIQQNLMLKPSVFRIVLQKTVERSIIGNVSKFPVLKILINAYYFDITWYLFVKPFL